MVPAPAGNQLVTWREACLNTKLTCRGGQSKREAGKSSKVPDMMALDQAPSPPPSELPLQQDDKCFCCSSPFETRSFLLATRSPLID